MALETSGNQDGQGAGASSTGTPADSSSPATSPHQPSATAVGSTTSATPAAGAAGAGNGTGTPGAAAAGTPAVEDRSTWVPPHRIRQQSRELAQLRRELDQARSQIGAITGIQPPRVAPSARLPEGVTEEMLQRARDEFGIVMPHLSKLTAEQVDKLVNFLDSGMSQSEETTNRMWARHGQETVASIKSVAKEQLGDIGQKGMDRLLRNFHSNLATDQDFYERYQAGDTTLVTEFITNYKQDLLDPYHNGRAGAAASAITRARTLPRAGASSSVVPAGRGAADAELDPADEDALHKRAYQRMQARSAAR